MIVEQCHISDSMDIKGLKEGDYIEVVPLSGNRSTFQLNRPKIDFISHHHLKKMSKFSARVLGSMNKESFHVQLRLVETKGRNNQKKKRYLIEVLEGAPIKLNGNYVFHAYLEQGDFCEIGFNRLQFKSNLVKFDFDPQKKLIFQNLKIVRSTLPILIEGETGVGKTSLAQKVHDESGRLGRFVHINISSFAENIIESELFGHIKGAFTGAINDKKGALKEADGGTLFIDEIDSLPIDVQTKLLIFLDSFKYRPVGSTREQEVNTRLIFSSGQDLSTLISKSLMRKDFYFRISCGEHIKLESLRDDSKLIEKYCELFSVENGVSISPKLVDFYKSLPWPGNYRQLKGHLCKKKVLCVSTKLEFDENDERLLVESSSLLEIDEVIKTQSLQSVKEAYAKKVYYLSDCNYTVAAKKLEISAKSLRNLIKEAS